jgi:hypothetical protein
MYLILQKNYKTENKEDENYQLGKIYHKKLCTNAFKVTYFIAISIISYYILRQLDFFPTSLGGSGEIVNMFKDGYPGYFFFWKPDYFNIYYLGTLGYHVIDLIWLCCFYELQSDFVMMILHHVCTISLIFFSYMANYTNVGCIVMFLHDFSDIFVYAIRTMINTDLGKITKVLSGVILLVVFVYTRIYVFGDLLYSIITEFTRLDCWDYMNTLLTLFLSFLYVMHIYWVYSILKKMADAIFKNKISDTGKIKKIR